MLGRWHFRCNFYFGMYDVESAVERRWFPENNIVYLCVVFLHGIFHAFKPHEFDGIFAIGENCCQALIVAFAYFLEPYNLAFYLNKRHFFIYLVQIIKPTSVHIFVWVVSQQILDTVDAKFFVEQICLFRSYTGQKFYILIR